MYLYHTQFKEISNAIHQKKLGKIKEINFKFGIPDLKNPGFRFNPKLCGGAFWDVGCYSISAALKLFKNETVKVKYLDLRYSKKYGVDDSGSVILDFSNDTRVVSTWGFGMGYKNEIDIWGQKGSLYSDKIFSKLDGYTPELRYRDLHGVEK